jgi:hypothetical protein
MFCKVLSFTPHMRTSKRMGTKNILMRNYSGKVFEIKLLINLTHKTRVVIALISKGKGKRTNKTQRNFKIKQIKTEIRV